MPLKLKLDENKIYHKEFEGTKPGYNALQVDSFLDIVIKDYEMMDNYIASAEETIEDLTKMNKMLKDRLAQIEANNAVMNEKLKNISDNENASLSNLDLLKRISALEQALYKAGINPNTIE